MYRGSYYQKQAPRKQTTKTTIISESGKMFGSIQQFGFLRLNEAIAEVDREGMGPTWQWEVRQKLDFVKIRFNGHQRTSSKQLLNTIGTRELLTQRNILMLQHTILGIYCVGVGEPIVQPVCI